MTDGTFDPTRYLTKVSGRDYLEVKWRLVWLRSVHPLAQIETELVEHRNNMAMFRARVTLPPAPVEVVTDDGEIVRTPWSASATGWGMESSENFGDYAEKAETKAIGRALGALGFGTQFAEDHAFGAEQMRVVDSPVDIRRGGGSSQPRQGGAAAPAEATPRQLKYLHAVAGEAGLTPEGLDGRARAAFGRGVADLTRRDVSQLIEQIQAERPEPLAP